MSLLWKDFNIKNLLTIHKRPSPTYGKHISCFAQSKTPIHHFIEGISLFISCKRRISASMTVEAAIVLPLFMFFFLNLGSAIEMIRLHGNLELALWEVGNRVSVYGHVLNKKEEKTEEFQDSQQQPDSWWMELAGVTLSYTYVKSQLVEYLGKDYLEGSPLTYGVDGLQFIESDIWESDGRFEIVLTYSVSPLSGMSGFRPFRMANRYYGHLWNGYQIPGTHMGAVEDEYVYITENGTVYHTNRNCTHLVLSVQPVSLQQALLGKNEHGEKYSACEKCRKSGYWGRVYITNDGTCYHFERDCPGLKRTIRCVLLSQVKDRSLCMRCGL